MILDSDTITMTLRAPMTEQAREIYAEGLRRIRSRTDRVFGVLIALEWLAGIATALWVSPLTWAGVQSQVHPHVLATVFLGGLFTLFPVALVWLRPGTTLTRHTVAIAQMLWSAMFIHLTAGRIETHFHVFGSLAFLAWYMDSRVLLTATLVTVADHVARSYFWPQSVFGTDTISGWRAFEHGAWIIFEDTFLAIWIHYGLKTLWDNAVQQARLEKTNQVIENKVRDRTFKLQTYADKMERAQLQLSKQAEVLESQAVDLKTANQAAQDASQAKSEFLANMSHEIRTPMTAILGFADLLGDSVITPEQMDAVNTIKRNGGYLLDLVNDILDLSKVEAGKFQVERLRCRTLSIIADVASLMRVRAAAKGLQLNVEYVGPIPETIETDATRLRQILINLLGNAIKFTEVGTARLVVQMHYTEDGTPQLQCDVIDTGLGMSEAQIEKLFRPFTQADASMTRRFGGTGLGLTISKRFAEMLDGDLSVVSQPAVGSTFTLRVAVGNLAGVRMLAGPIEAAPSQHEREPACRIRVSGHILMAEDGPDNQRLIAFVLRQAGATVTIADNGQIAVDMMREALALGRPFDCVLMDMQMPVLDGYRATQQLRDEGYQGPIIALTAHAMAADQGRCLAVGCDDYTTKPIQRSELLALVSKYLPAPVEA